MSLMDYDQTLDNLKEQIAPEALALLRRVRDVCRAEGLATDDEPFDMCCDTFRWSMVVYRTANRDAEGSIDVSLEIAEEREYEGEGFGVNFGMDIVEWGGRILGGLCPYNYTERCWVDARRWNDVRERWALVRDSDISSIPDLIRK